jgi:hypothetical protein
LGIEFRNSAGLQQRAAKSRLLVKSLLLLVLFLNITGSLFGQTYLITDAGPIYTCSGTLYDSGGESGDYSDNENNSLTIYSDDGSALIAEIAEFDTQWPDILRIYDGPNTSSPLLAEHVTSVVGTPSYLSSGDCLTFEFVSNTGSVDPGFRINLSCVPIVTGYLISDGGPLNLCSGNLFDSGGLSGDYGPNEDYQITIYSADGRSVEADFLTLSLEGGDSLRIYDGPNTSGTQLANLISGSSPGVYTSSGTSLTFHFTSDNTDEAAGFVASLSCVPVTIGYLISDGGTVNTCAARVYDTGGQGGDYSRGEDYSISFCSDDGGAMVVDFTAFEYADGDYFYVYDGPNTSSPQLAAITNSNSIPGPFTSSGTCLTIRSITDNNAAVGDGFAANITCTPIVQGYLISDEGTVNTCGANFFDSGGQGGDYGSTDDYIMTFCSDDGSPLEVDFGSIDIRDSDYLYVYDGTSTSDPLLATFTSTTTVQGPFISSGTCLTFRFTADGGTTGNGFAAVISCYVDPCSPDVTPPSITGCPAPIIVNADTSYCGATVSWAPPTASDNCSVVLSSTHNPGDRFALGTTTVTYTATDGAGFTDLCTFDVTVNPAPQPTISGSLSVCNPSTATYSVADPGSHTFLWTVTNGSIVGSDTNSSVDVLWNVAGTGIVSVVITSGSACTNSNNVNVDVSAVVETEEISSSTSLTRR